MNTIERLVGTATNRIELWSQFVLQHQVAAMAEVGVWKGEFAEQMLRQCGALQAYYLLDPWRHLAEWNKPFNVADQTFDAVMAEALARTEFAKERRIVCRGETKEASGQIPDATLDLCYIDGDHTLRGVLIDLMKMYPKVKDGGWLGGDDMTPYAWVHGREFEPTMVFPTVIHFAEATGSEVYALPYGQFVMRVDRTKDAFAYHDLAGCYQDTSLRKAMRPRLRHDVYRGLRNALVRR